MQTSLFFTFLFVILKCVFSKLFYLKNCIHFEENITNNSTTFNTKGRCFFLPYFKGRNIFMNSYKFNKNSKCIYYYNKKLKNVKTINKRNLLLTAKKINQKEVKRKKNYQYAMKHMYDKNGKRIKDINKERKSLKKKNIFDYEGFKVDQIFTCLPEEDMQELREEELKIKSGEILHNNKYIDTYGVESDADIEEI
ncbi:conserved protein, unknown function [Hepatocystis sp. ex Piliocolobus tephrosceles]|nr:conserved protein, unknown function [Hepatocystis sp. ex Piliocolobus tephrosceles]